MSHERSSCLLTASASVGAQKLGQPVPESNFVSDANSGAPQHTHLNMPSRFSRLSACENAGSVPCWRVTRYCSGVSSFRHSSSVLMLFPGRVECMGLLLGAVNRDAAAGSFNPVRALGNTAPINQR